MLIIRHHADHLVVVNTSCNIDAWHDRITITHDHDRTLYDVTEWGDDAPSTHDVLDALVRAMFAVGSGTHHVIDLDAIVVDMRRDAAMADERRRVTQPPDFVLGARRCSTCFTAPGRPHDVRCTAPHAGATWGATLRQTVDEPGSFTPREA